MDALDASLHADVMRAINAVSVFSGIGVHEQNMLANKMAVEQHQAEEVIIDQGAIGDKLYIIMRGTVTVSMHHKYKGWVIVTKLGPGEVFGEIAILRNIRRTARITTETPCTFMSISAHDFLEVYQYFPDKARDNIQLFISKRLEQNKFLLHP